MLQLQLKPLLEIHTSNVSRFLQQKLRDIQLVNFIMEFSKLYAVPVLGWVTHLTHLKLLSLIFGFKKKKKKSAALVVSGKKT